MNASVTGVKTILAEFNKTIADPTAVKVSVKKGTAARGCKATVEGSKITLAMDAKLTKGDYTVTVEGVDKEAMSANVTVEKDETLTTFEIADYLVADAVDNVSSGTIKYAALNQYGEKMTTSNPTPTCSFGSASIKKSATATAEGTIYVEKIQSVLTIVGTKGTIVLVGDMGVTATKEISFNNAATATTAEIVGTYHKNSATLKSITENDKANEYELLFTAKDQYGYDISAEDASGLTITIVGGLTNVSKGTDSLSTRTYDGKDYIAVPLEGGTTLAGDVNVMIVNSKKGLLVNTTFSVAKDTVIKSISITADNEVYENQDNEMAFEIIDADGKAVTGYAELTSAVRLPGWTDSASGNRYGMRFERKNDGTAKLLYNPGSCVPLQADTDKASAPQVVSVEGNKATTSDFFLKTFTFTVYQKRFVKGVTGIKSDVVTSVSKNGDALTINSTDLVLADQYSNKVTSDQSIFEKEIFDGKSAGKGTSVVVVTNGAVDVTIDTSDNMIVAEPKNVGTATVYLKYCYDSEKTVTASASDYDAKFTISVYDTAGVDVNTLAIDSVNDGFTVKDTATLKAENVKVVAMVGGNKTVIPTDQYVIVKTENDSFSVEEMNKGVDTKTAKITVQVTTWDSTNTPISTQITKEYQVSDAANKLYKVTDAKTVSDGTANVNDVVSASAFVKNFKFKDQYGIVVDGCKLGTTKSDSVTYKVEMITATNKSGYTITSNGLNAANIKFTAEGTYKIKVTATTPDGSSKDYTYTVTVKPYERVQ